ncbi:UvrD-helicase domain-containing protein [Radiobacillus sp. PE A8.2]|uniref:UvrD-helicase domain-containing protein n=1 Tax=Radiobacillus sp. PE A8.2 TaxID=3380349 RepID=UPI0038910380
MSREIVDQQARVKIEQELSTNFLVEAGAGSGKTTSLVQRMVNLIYTGTCEVNKIVAITFTRKAADELKLRFQAELEKKWQAEVEPASEIRLAHALQNMEQCFIGTVHAFCAKLLRERPIEAKLDLTFQELEETADQELLEEAWHRYLYLLQETNPEQLSEMNLLGIKIDELFETLKDIKNYPDVEWITSPTEKPQLLATYQSFVAIIQEAKRALPETEPDKKYDSLQKAILATLMKMRHIDEASDKQIIEIFELFDKNVKPTLNRWESKEDAKYYHEKITSMFDQSVKGLLQAWREYCHHKVIAILSGAMQVYEQLKKQRSLLNYQDLLIKANALLKDNPEIRSYFQQRYHCLLVDEFQDTDPIQAEIMFFLTGEDHHQRLWTACKPKPGSLFVVGDPKQAIYRFRRADIDTYNRVKQLIEAHDGEVLQLTMNFRTVNTVTEKLNGVFQHALPENESLYQAAYRPLHAFHQDTGNKPSGIKRLAVSADYTNKDEVISQDAENIALYIQAQLGEGFAAKDFMVLTRYNDGIATYAQKIEDYGIPVSVSGEIVIGEIIEFQDLLTLLNTFVDPTDSLALVATLRSVFFGISDDDLYQWKQAGGYFSVYSDMPNTLPVQTQERFTIALTKLATYQKWIRAFNPATAIEKIIDDSGFYPLLLHNKHGKRAQKSLLQIIEAMRKAESNGTTTYQAMCELFTSMVMEKTAVANLEEDADAVRVMNVHKAKGLEAPVVFLVHPKKQVDPESFLSKHIKREDNRSKGYFSFSIKKSFQSKTIALPLDWENMKAEELRYLTEEEIRILYVAATRAEQALIISSSAKNDNKNPWRQLLAIEDVEQVELPEVERGEETSQTTTLITLQEFQTQTTKQLDWLETSKHNTYRMWSPTDDKDYAALSGMERAAGGGQAWGTIIHEVLEKVVQGKDVDNFIKNSLKRHRIPADREPEVKDYVRIWKQSTIWDELQFADQVLTEVPISIKVASGDPLYPLLHKQADDYSPVLVKGVIDLIYRKDGQWTIVDYKTDRPEHADDFKRLRDFYRDQITFYERAWEYMTGDKVKESRLFFFSEVVG